MASGRSHPNFVSLHGSNLTCISFTKPALGTGNVGEMALDLLITSSSAIRIATMENEHLLPAIGNDPFTMEKPGTLVSSMELYQVASLSSDRLILLLTQRSPPITGHQAPFATAVVQWAKSVGVGQILVLTGLDASMRRDAQLIGPCSTRFLRGGDLGKDLSGSLGSLHLEPLEQEYREEEEASHGLLPPWVTLRAFEAEQVPYLLLGAFALEGDNVSVAMEVAKLAMTLGGLKNEVKMPCSFSSVYGRSVGLQFLA